MDEFEAFARWMVDKLRLSTYQELQIWKNTVRDTLRNLDRYYDANPCTDIAALEEALEHWIDIANEAV